MDDKNRCAWCIKEEIYKEYHDKEWGIRIYDDNKLFEYLILECFQAGLSWITILKKRENFRKAFDNFDYNKIAKYDEVKFSELINNSGIIRNKLKIRAATSNAKAFIAIRDEFGSFSKYIWAFVNHKPIKNAFKTLEEIPAKTELSDKISKDLKSRGFKFVGSTVIYAHMQATGMVNDHLTNCFRYKELEEQNIT
jgi:DNA-3-methyladenine glycosylase I